jgi:hypothetical protein
MRDLSKLSDAELKVHAVTRLGLGALPIENWACFFEPSICAYRNDPALANRAFSIWVPTMIDFIEAEPQMATVEAEASRRAVDCADVFDLGRTLGLCMRGVLRLLTREEQVFIRDRRLQNVHGNLDYFLEELPTIKWYDALKDAVVRERITESDLHFKLLRPFNEDIAASQATLRLRVVASDAWRKLFQLHRSSLNRADLEELVGRLGIGV